jgi:hypothetical protein
MLILKCIVLIYVNYQTNIFQYHLLHIYDSGLYGIA